MTRPVVGLPCDWRMIGAHPFHAVGEKYIAAVAGGAGAIPLLIPVLADPLPVDDVLAAVDGLLFTGSPSNVSPKLYGGPAPRDGVLQDENRDALSLPLMKRAIERSVPIFCLCRGFQELNVALGGTLFQHLEEQPGRIDHREDKTQPLDIQYGPAHDVSVTPSGLLERILEAHNVECRSFAVNSLHSQGVDRLAAGLVAEATADDGTVEAVSVRGARGFALGVQWHPEWKYSQSGISTALFRSFGDAVRAHARSRTRETV